jgi:hypothetical protein
MGKHKRREEMSPYAETGLRKLAKIKLLLQFFNLPSMLPAGKEKTQA